jgi:hypothetical protein
MTQERMSSLFIILHSLSYFILLFIRVYDHHGETK